MIAHNGIGLTYKSSLVRYGYNSIAQSSCTPLIKLFRELLAMGLLVSKVCQALQVTRDFVVSVLRDLRLSDFGSGVLIGAGATSLALAGTLGPIGAIAGAVLIVSGIAGVNDQRMVEKMINGVVYVIKAVKNGKKYKFTVSQKGR